MITFAKLLFWIGAFGLFYVYAGYPLLVYLVSRFFPRKIVQGDFEPKVSVVITAYNEERDIREKLENTLSIDYPAEKLEIIVASDCSSDRTDAIVGEFADRGVKLYRQTHRGGKTSAQNMAVERATGEVILFSDATTLYQPDVLRAMLPNFADHGIGCVAGKLIYVDESESGVGKGARSYWSYETFLKESESRACSLIGVSGCLYAVRKSAYQPMPPEACSDFFIATLVYRQGLRTIYEPNAVCTEETNRHSAKEMRMRVRIIAQTFNDLWRNREMLNPFRTGFFAVELISHKVLRYCVPLILILMLVASGAAGFQSSLFLYIFILQVIFYGFAAAAWLLERNQIKSSLLAIPLYFTLSNLAALFGFIKFLQGERYSHWEPIRENQPKIDGQDAVV
ncbi:MAG TPA: glycosyltransferase family 2 protein [Pyrinomonadaceae bacterium]|jgi:cellulose synthase/poly-beta-1,6-N-acetylglucosamine synthase-like glycosyltransferase